MTQLAEMQTPRPGGLHVVTEVEDKFDVPLAYVVPDVSDLTGGGFTGEAELQDLDATYYDTADRRLLAAGITLRRRSGGTDAGWHLKLPKGVGVRTEVRLPAGGSRLVPGALVSQVAEYTAGRRLLPLARLQTERTLYTVWDATGRPLVELALDQVTASVPGVSGGISVTWCELEVELVDGDPDLLAPIGRRLTDAGATPGRYPSKLARALA